MSRNTLYLRPLNGLGNRMRAVAAGRALAADAGVRLVVLWSVEKQLGASYHDLFAHDDSFEVRNLYPDGSLRDALAYLLYSEVKQVKGIPTGWITRAYFGGRIHHQVRPETFSEEALRRMAQAAPRMLLSSWWSFYRGADLDFSFFRMHPSEEAEVDTVSAAFSDKTFGVHIRRTDNRNAIRYSPTHAFIAAIRDRIAVEPHADFFLTTDCLETEEEIRAQFGERIITRPHDTTRASTRGMRDAVVDMFLLSRTRHIFGSYYSTFSETAASLGGIEWVTVTDDPALVGNCNNQVLVATRSGGTA